MAGPGRFKSSSPAPKAHPSTQSIPSNGTAFNSVCTNTFTPPIFLHSVLNNDVTFQLY